MKRFFQALVRWRKWCREMCDTTWVERARNRPGLRFNYILFRAPDGSVWTWAKDPGSYVRMAREGTAEWAKTDEIREFVEADLVRSFDEPDSDWPWYRSLDGDTELSYRESGVQSARRGVAFACALLAQRKAIEAWAQKFVVGKDRRDARSLDEDFASLVATFFPFGDPYELGIPDNGSVLCALHAALDVLGGHEGVRTYWF